MSRTYHEFQPSTFDGPGNFVAHDREAIDEIQSWLVGPSRNRDSDCLTESNFAVILEDLGGEGDNVQVRRFGHWACGWYELVVVRPETPEAASLAEWEAALENYPVASEDDLSNREDNAAQEVWANCYNDSERIEYMRQHPSQFDCLYSGPNARPLSERWTDILANARGRHFSGYASEILG